VQRHLWRELHQTRTRLVAADRMVTMGQLLEGISEAIHSPIKETANVLAALPEQLARVESQLGPKNEADARLLDGVCQVEAQVSEARARAERAAKLLTAVRDHTVGLNETTRALFTARERAESAALLLSHRAQRAGVRIDTSGLDQTLTLEGDPGKLEQILTASMLMLLEMAPNGAATCLRISADQRHDGTQFDVRIDAQGFAQALTELLRAPRPVLSSENAASGVGLFVARHLAEGSYGGTLRAIDAPRETGLSLWCPKGKAQQHSRPSYRPGGGLGTVKP
jgi:C4-dicarboxylate-specific signal transduction histidine kinase